LRLVLQYVGAGEALYITPVSSSWAACYKAVPQHQTWRHLHTSGCTSWQAAFATPSRIRLAHANGLRLNRAETSPLVRDAGLYADIATLQVAHELGLPWSQSLVEGAARSSVLSKLQWLVLQQHCPLPERIAEFAAAGGSVDMLRWLKQKGVAFDEKTSEAAARKAHNLHVLAYLVEEGCSLHVHICDVAADKADLELLQWLHSRGCVLGVTTAAAAAEAGALHVLEWLQQQGAPFNALAVERAAKWGRLHICQWLRAAQCEWDEDACTAAARWGHLETLRWLFDNGCPRDGTMLWLAGCTRDAVAQYLMEQQVVPDNVAITLMLNFAGSHGNLAAAKFLRQHGADWPAVLERGHMNTPWCGEVLKWARAEGCTSPIE
jgi:hypothetical protein